MQKSTKRIQNGVIFLILKSKCELCTLKVFSSSRLIINENNPLDFLRFHEQMWTFYGIFEIGSNSKQLIFSVYLIVVKTLFAYIGCIIQFLAIVNAQTLDEAIQILFISFAYLNASLKTLIFHLKTREIQRLWMKLDDKDYAATRIEEKM